jgi:hypothetical protein
MRALAVACALAALCLASAVASAARPGAIQLKGTAKIKGTYTFTTGRTNSESVFSIAELKLAGSLT